MIRGTTAQFKFKLPYIKGELSQAIIKFWQPNNPSGLLPITRTLNDCGGPNNAQELYVSLRPDETAMFSEKYKAKVQLRATHATSGTIFGSRPQLITVYPMNDEIIGEDPEAPDIPVENEDGWVIFDGGAIVDGDD